VYDDDSGGDSGVDDDLFPGISLLKHHSFNCWVLEVCLIDLHLLSSHLSLPLESVITWRSTLFKQLPFILSCMYHLTYLLIVVLDTEPRALYMLGKSSTAGVRPIPLNCHLHVVNNLLALKTCIVHYYRYSGS
jgi:hypothetical protein